MTSPCTVQIATTGPLDGWWSTLVNPRRSDSAVDRMSGSIREFSFKIPVLARSDGEIVDGHLRLKAAHEPLSTKSRDLV